MGLSLGSRVMIIGLSTSWGSPSRAPSSISLVWSTAKSILVPQANSRVRQETPSLEMDSTPWRPGNTADGGLERNRDQGFHLLWGDSRILGDYGQFRIADVRQKIDADPAKGDEAQQDDGDEKHGGRHRTVDRKTGDPHASLFKRRDAVDNKKVSAGCFV